MPLEGAHAAPGDDESLACGRGEGHLVDFAQIGCRLNRLICTGHRGGRERGNRRGGNHDVQFIPSIPDQGDGPDLLRQLYQMKREGFAPSTHGQDQALVLAGYGLGRPLDRHVLLGVVRVAVTRVARTQLVDGLDIGKKLVTDHLDRLTMQRKLPALGFPLQVVSARPGLYFEVILGHIADQYIDRPYV